MDAVGVGEGAGAAAVVEVVDEGETR